MAKWTLPEEAAIKEAVEKERERVLALVHEFHNSITDDAFAELIDKITHP